ncbi:MAG: DUF2095 family protein [Candidatus Heimdallarchaeaceae archaeon]
MERKKEKDAEMGDSEEDFKEYFPAIYRELKSEEEQLFVNEIRTSTGAKKIRKFRGYDPSIVDFICRCKTEEEAKEIIDYMFKRQEITEEEKKQLLEQLEKEGLESFGPHRAPGYYERA